MLVKYSALSAWQKRRLLITFFAYMIVGLVLLSGFVSALWEERRHTSDKWDSYLTDSPEAAETAAQLSANAVEVTVGTYIDNLRELNMKSSYYRVEFMVWFSWEGDADLNPADNFRVYKGLVNKQTLVKETHENGKNYQLLNMDVSVSKNFDTKRFPLESHQMRLYVESTRPVQEVMFVPDRANSGMNENIAISGFDFLRHDVGAVTYAYETSHGDPDVADNIITSEIVSMFEINRSGFGLYFKCFIALVGTITWALITMFLSAQHHVDPLGMIPGALFGTVANIMVGANLLPDALDAGLLEYVNIWGIFTILAVSIVVINVNRIRNKFKDSEFAHHYGTVMFITILLFTIAGQFMLPLTAYINM